MFCPKCGANLPDGTKFCSNCGANVDTTVPNAPQSVPSNNQPVSNTYQQNTNSPHGWNNGPHNQEDLKFWQKSWFMWVCLIFFTPLGLILCYVNRDRHPKWKIICGVFIVLLGIGALTSTNDKQNQKTNSTTQENVAVTQQANDSKTANIDWDKAIATTKDEILKQETLVKDVTIDVKQDDKRIEIYLACNNAINQSAAAEAADTAVRRLSANVALQDNSIAPASKDYWGGLWDIYALQIGVARTMDVKNNDKWLINDYVKKGTHAKHKFKGLNRM